MLRKPKLSRAALEQLADDSAQMQKAQASLPTWADIQKSFPDAKIVDTPDGKRSCRIEDRSEGKKKLRLLNEMFKQKNHMDAELGQKRHARHKEVVLRDPRGNLRYVREEHVERVERRTGARALRRRTSSTVSYLTDAQGRKWVRHGFGDWEPA